MLLSAAAAASAAVMTVCWLLILPAGSASKSTGSDAGSRLMKRRCFSVQHVNNMTGIESAPKQLAQCWFPGLAISIAKR